MASREENETKLHGVVAATLRRWLDKARDMVMAPWRSFRMQPEPTAVFSVQGSWDDEVETILTTIGQISMDAWSQAIDVPPVSRHSFVMSELGQVENLLRNIPSEVADLVFAEIIEGVNGGETMEQVAERVDRVLSWSGNDRWPNRAKTISVTELTRAYGIGTLAAGMEQSRVSGRMLRKRWDTEHDEKVRPSHREVDGDIVSIFMPFYVDGFPMMMPGDVTAPPSLVIGCRCDLTILDERGR